MARRIDLQQRFYNADDSVAKNKDNEAVTLKDLLIQTCLTDVVGFGPDGRPIPVPGDEKGRRYELYGRIKRAGRYIELDAEDITFLKTAARFHPTLACGQICDMLEMKKQDTSKTPPKDEDDKKQADTSKPGKIT